MRGNPPLQAKVWLIFNAWAHAPKTSARRAGKFNMRPPAHRAPGMLPEDAGAA